MRASAIMQTRLFFPPIPVMADSSTPEHTAAEVSGRGRKKRQPGPFE